MTEAVSVVIPTRNGRAHLERCLPTLLASSAAALEVVVVDNGSTDGTPDWLREHHPEVRVLPMGCNRGFGRALAEGVSAARHPYVAFLNDDTVVERDWLEPLLRALRSDPSVAAACSTLRLLERPDVVNARGGGFSRYGFGYDLELMVAWDQPPAAGASSEPVDVLFPTAAAMLMRKADFVAAGGFDPAFFMYNEDVDLGWRLWLAGRRVLWCPDSVVRHLRGGSSTGNTLRDRMGARHCVRSLLKNYHPENAARALVGLARYWIRHRQYGRLLDVVAWNLLHLPGTLWRRLQVQWRRARTDGELFRRGLIDEAAFPPPHPEAPQADPARDGASWVESPTLLPGHDSAAGRLGPGWYAPEWMEDRPARMTAGLARAFLRASPGQRYRLVATLRRARRGDDVFPREVCLRANGARASATLAADGWRGLAVETTADAAGLVHVEIEAPVWVGHHALGNTDFRRLGVAVGALTLQPKAPARVLPHPLVSVLVPTHNRLPILMESLAALEAQTWPEIEAIVVDDGSGDGTWAWLERRAAAGGRLALRVLRQENQGPGAARNRGLREARGDLVLLLGDDVLPEPGCVEAHVRRHQRLGEPCAVIGFVDWDRSRMRVTPLLEYVNLNGEQFGFGQIADGGDAPFTCFYTSNISLPRDVLAESPFDPTFATAAWEDIELGYRLSRRGLRIVHERSASARHFHPMDLARFYRRQRHVGAAVKPLLALHPHLEARLVPPAPAPLRWAPSLGPLLEAALPLLNLLDRRGMALPPRVYQAMLTWAFHRGFRLRRRLHG